MSKYVERTNKQTGEKFNAKILTMNERSSKYVAELKTGYRHRIDKYGNAVPATDENGVAIALKPNQKTYRSGFMASQKANQSCFRKKNPNYVRKTGKRCLTIFKND